MRFSVTARRSSAATIAGTNPIFTSGYPSDADSAAKIRSLALAIPAPPPSARPCTAATTGCGCRRIASSTSASRRAVSRCSTAPASLPLSSDNKSNPAQKSLPAPVIKTTRTAASFADCASASPSPAITSAFSALRFSGRFSVMRATPPSARYKMRSIASHCSPCYPVSYENFPPFARPISWRSPLTWGQAPPAAPKPAATAAPKPAPAAPAAAATSADPVVLTIGTEKITKSQFEQIFAQIVEQMPPERRAAAQAPQAKRQLAEQLAELKALAQEARREKIDQTPEAKAQLAMRSDQLVAGCSSRRFRKTPSPPPPICKPITTSTRPSTTP